MLETSLDRRSILTGEIVPLILIANVDQHRSSNNGENDVTRRHVTASYQNLTKFTGNDSLTNIEFWSKDKVSSIIQTEVMTI